MSAIDAEVPLGNVNFRSGPATRDWLVSLRWIALGGILSLFLIARMVFDLPLSIWPAALVASGVVLSNLMLYRASASSLSSWSIAGVLTLDISLLTGILSSYGGHTNPFTLLYLLHVILAVLLLPRVGAWAVGSFAIVGYGVTFLWYVPLDALSMHAGHHGFSLHLEGMLVAFILVTLALATFVSKIRSKLDYHELGRRQAEERERQLSMLTALAASTAHDLGTPLATIAILADDLNRGAKEGHPLSEYREDLLALKESSLSCQGILSRMQLRAGSLQGESPKEGSLQSALHDVIAHLSPGEQSRISLRGDDITVNAPQYLLRYAISCLVRNALEAGGGPVRIELREEIDHVTVLVDDTGEGISDEVRAQWGTPFLSTKGPGRGLGIFLTELFARGVGGRLTVERLVPRGTRVMLAVPRIVAWKEKEWPPTGTSF